MRKGPFYIIFLLTLFSTHFSFGQCPINSLGQNPSTAFPVCGTSSFIQAQVNLCGGKSVPNPKCNTNVLTDINPYWYKFTCYETGTLGFTIEPNSNQSDYDWQVFDITGRNEDDVYTDKTLSVSSNWSQYFGNTGTTTTAASIFECEGPVPQNSKMPVIVKGHQYILLVSHFSNTQAGYKLNFGGGTASITDTSKAHLKTLYGSCDGRTLGVKLTRPMKCSSLASNGSDFKLQGGFANIIRATSPDCGHGFEMDSIVLTLDKALPAGNYTIVSQNGTDGNTLLEFCDNALPVDDSVSVALAPALPTPMDSIQPVGCNPAALNLIFKKPMLCSSIAANGSDFSITGPSAISITGASGSCVSGVSSNVSIKLSGPIQVGGLYTVTLNTGSDGNTLINDCTKETPAGSTITFRAYDTVSAAIDYVINSSCVDDTIKLANAGLINVNSWKWTFEDGTANTQATQRVYSKGTKTISLVVSNGVCTDSSALSISFDKNRVKAVFLAPAYVCPQDTAVFADSSTGPIDAWLWDFGNGITSTQQQPPYQFYPTQITLQQYTASLIVIAANGCSDSVSKIIQVPGNCYIAVPNAFTPNGDGLNDFLYPLNAYKAVNLDFKVYDRYGQLIWKTKDWTKKWDGRINGSLQASGTYVWHLTYTDSDKNKKVDLKGTTSLIR
jgi:gliding motility-associated-like protein